jgi:D-3-phosphoglycerate dehydrogenase
MPMPFPRPVIKVLLLENVHASALEIFKGEGYQIEAVNRALKEEELAERLAGGVNLLGIRSKTKVTAKALEAGRNLLAVGAFCIGTNQIDLNAAKKCGVPVFNAPFSNTRSVAELVICEVVMLSRHLGDRSREVHEGKWRKVANPCYEKKQLSKSSHSPWAHPPSTRPVLRGARGLLTVSIKRALSPPRRPKSRKSFG